MTEEQILELAKEHLEVLVADDDEMEFPTDFAATKEQLIAFARQVRRDTLFEAVSILQNVPNPEANRTAINKILNQIEMELK